MCSLEEEECLPRVKQFKYLSFMFANCIDRSFATWAATERISGRNEIPLRVSALCVYIMSP